jgi:hypothetical protein
MLEEAVAEFVVQREENGWRIGSLRGWDCPFGGEPEPEIVAAIAQAYPMPTSVHEAWEEFRYWKKICLDREARGMGYGTHSPAVEFRVVLLERVLDSVPATSLRNLRARFDWIEDCMELERGNDAKAKDRLAVLRHDV